MARMKDETLRALLDHEIQQSVSWHMSTVRTEQERNLAYYLGLPLGNEVEGRSQVLSWDVFEVVEAALPSFIEPFFSGDHIGEFQPRGIEDEAYADQATDFINYIIKDQNPGFLIFTTWIKDALLSKFGIVRADWIAGEQKRQELAGLTVEQLVMLQQDGRCQIIEQAETPQPLGSAVPVLYDVTVLIQQPGRVCIENVKPETFVLSRGAESLEAANLKGEIVAYTRSKLVEMGFSKAKALEVNDYDGAFSAIGELDDVRQDGESPMFDTDSPDPALQEVRLFRGFVRADYDGDGIAEYRRVLVGGNLILENEPADEHNYAMLTPIPVPHRAIGLSYADPAAEIQRLKTGLMRQYMDSLYLANHPRTYVNMDARVNLGDLLSTKIGGIVRGQGPAQNAVAPLQTTIVARDALEGINFADTLRETRLGVSRYNQGLDADSLNKTAMGVSKIMAAADKRQMMTLRILAETGIKDLFRLVLRLVTRYQDMASVIRLRNQWVQMDPRGWNPEMDVSIAVGIGTGDRSETLMLLQQFGAFMAQAAQAGVVTPKNVYEFGKMLAKNARLRGADEKLLTDPSTQEPKPPQPTPEQIKAQADAQKTQFQAQAEAVEADKQRAHEERMKAAELTARKEEKLLELAAGLLARNAPPAPNLMAGTMLDQSAQAPGMTPGNVDAVAAEINALAQALQQQPEQF